MSNFQFPSIWHVFGSKFYQDWIQATWVSKFRPRKNEQMNFGLGYANFALGRKRPLIETGLSIQISDHYG